MKFLLMLWSTNFLSEAFGFFNWVGIFHFLNILFLSFLIRSGIEILGAHPKLYWNDDCRLGSEWLRFSRQKLPKDKLWTSKEEEVSFSPWIALPGGKNLGMGRHWHFFTVVFWILSGVFYAALLFGTGEWRRLIPTALSVFPAAWQTALTYLSFNLPPPGNPYNPIQQLTYAGVVFLLAPLTIATGAAMSPAVAARFPFYTRIFGGRQAARSIHFLCLVAFCLFTLGHVFLVLIEDAPRNIGWIIHGERRGYETLSIIVALAGLVVVGILHVAATKISLRNPRAVQRALGVVTQAVRRPLLHHLTSRQNYRERDVSPFARVNGDSPETAEYTELSQSNFKDWRLNVGGLVETPLELSLDELRTMPNQTQITKHNCIQGWSYIAKWTGVRVADVLARSKPLPDARYVLFRAFDVDEKGRDYYEVIDLELAKHQQTVLAFEMNGAPLSVPHGAPCRLRVETQLGFKMAKYLRSIELVADFRSIGDGQGGYREDTQFYDTLASI